MQFIADYVTGVCPAVSLALVADAICTIPMDRNAQVYNHSLEITAPAGF